MTSSMDAVKRRAAKTPVSKLTSVSEPTRIEAIASCVSFRRTIRKPPSDHRRQRRAVNCRIPIFPNRSSSRERERDATESINFLDALSHSLRNPAAPTVAQCAAATIFSLLSVESFRPIIGHKRDIIFGLVEVVRSQGSRARSIKDALRALFGIALYPLNRGQMVELGAVQPLFSLVVKDGRVWLIEDATAVVAQVAGCEESWEVFKKALGIEVLMDLLDNATGSSNRTKENAISALLNLVQYGGAEIGSDIL